MRNIARFAHPNFAPSIDFSHGDPTYRYRDAVLLLVVGELDDELAARLLLAVVERPETTDHPDAVLGGYFAFRRHAGTVVVDCRRSLRRLTENVWALCGIARTIRSIYRSTTHTLAHPQSAHPHNKKTEAFSRSSGGSRG